MLVLLGFLYVLVASGASESNQTTCLSCSALGNCQEITCPPEQSFCLVNYTGSDLLENFCMNNETCQEYIQNNTVNNSTSCCQGNCSESTTVPETTSQPGNTTTVTGSNNCYYCSDSGTCEAFICPVGKDTCLSTVEVIGLGKNQSTFRRNGSCVASEDCQPQFYSLSYGYQLRSWVNVTCCSGGNCSEPPGPVDLPKGIPSNVLCPICSLDEASCDESLYLLCFQGETSCVNVNLLQLGGDSNITIQGCGSEDLCQLPENHTLGLDYQLLGQPNCSSAHQARLSYECNHNAATCLNFGVLLPALLGVWMAAWLA
ncbi:uncharacterized protein [Petaurus breviceps papuanus]|uniref:uncharacterized protein n=1 Tax=Petaurus breviceps papuanus TaxID=3040969 RepID=UPI0036D7DEAF